MNNATQKFIESLKKDNNVLGVILFGSWARGNNRQNSDVDLVVILKDGFKRAVEIHYNQVFEIIYTTEKSAFEFWESHKDDAYGLWEVAKIVFDTDNVVLKLKERILTVLNKGKKAIIEPQLGQLRFDADDQIRYVEEIKQIDITTASMILHNKVFALTELYFDLRQMWTPAPKQRLAKIEAMDRKLYNHLVDFYNESIEIEEKIKISKDIVEAIFDQTKQI